MKKVNENWIAVLEPTPRSYICPLCFKKSQNHERKRTRTLCHRWIPSWGTLYVEVPVYRQRCNDCNITWGITWQGIPERGKATEPFKRIVVEYCHKKSIELASKETGIPYSTVERWYYDTDLEPLPDSHTHSSPEEICIDEFALKKGHQYGLVLLDAKTGHVWQVSEGRSRKKIQYALEQWPFKQTPKVVVTDLAPGMSKTVRSIWPKANIVADKFHVLQLLIRSLNNARKLSGRWATKHLNIRHQQRLLLSKPNQLSNHELEQLSHWLEEDKRLEGLYQALQAFRRVYESPNREVAKRNFNLWIEHYYYHGPSVLKRISKTFLQWKTEILNYFTFRLTNAPIEGTNNLIKTIKRRAFGMRNLKRFAIRIRRECKHP
ncbi:ISL3 family transposase [Caldalkalibacillus thermarum]|uniref:ISL3 family transposase n=1 Tax=Caldalkalibacillus thermarum TaxID=296745 RepID=UPI001E45D4C5|nr:ISL3 family transposase [Caldalkalibacillus thermarum]